MEDIEIILERPTQDFTMIPNYILRDKVFSKKHAPFWLLCQILRKPSNWKMYRSNLIEELGIEFRTLDRMIASLKEFGYLKIERVSKNIHKWTVFVPSRIIEIENLNDNQNDPPKETPPEPLPQELSEDEQLLIGNISGFKIDRITPGILYDKEVKPKTFEDHVLLWNKLSEYEKFNERHPNLPKFDVNISKVTKLTDTRRKKFLKRIKEPEFQFKTILKKTLESDFLCGRIPDKSNNFMTFDWIIENDSNYVKVLEDKYKNRGGIQLKPGEILNANN